MDIPSKTKQNNMNVAAHTDDLAITTYKLMSIQAQTK